MANMFADLIPGGATDAPPSTDGNLFADLIPSGEAPAPVGGFWSSKAGRAIQGATEPIVGTAQLAAHATGIGTEAVDKTAREMADFYKRSRAEAGLTPEDWDYWAGLGNIASPINFVPGGAVARIAGPARTIMGTAGRAAAAGTAYGAMQPVSELAPGETFGEKKAEQAGIGAVAGGLTGAGVGALSRAVSPAVEPAARRLAAEGVELTPGQLLGGNVKRLEDIAAKTPFVGGMVRGAQERAMETFNTAAANRALAPIGERVPRNVSAGHEMIQHVEQRLSSAYDRVHSQMSAAVDPQLATDLASIFQQARTLVPDRLTQLGSIVDEQIIGKVAVGNGVIDGRTIQTITSELGRRASSFASDASIDARDLGRALNEVRDAFSAALERQNPQFAPELRSINSGWANFVRIREAASGTASQAREGRFTPTQLGIAARKMEKSAGKGASARGQALMQDIAESGRQVIPSGVADSGTPERLMTHGLLAGLYTGAINPAQLIPGLAIPALYSRTGQNLMRAAIMRRPPGAETVSNVLRQYGPGASTRALLQGNQ